MVTMLQVTLMSSKLDKQIMLCNRVAIAVLIQSHTLMVFLGVKKSISNTSNTFNAGEDVDETEPSCTVGGTEN